MKSYAKGKEVRAIDMESQRSDEIASVEDIFGSTDLSRIQ